jgi:hypothetical protein
MASEIFRLIGSILIDSSEADKSLSKTEDKSKSLASTLGGGIKTAAAVAVGIGTAAVAAGTAIYGVAEKAMSATDNVDKMSAKIGISKNGFQEWSYILGQNGMDVDKLQVGMKTLTAAMDSAAGGNATAQEKFRALGLTWEDGNGKLKSQEQMMNESIAALANMENGTEKARLATELFGKAGQEMMPMLNNGAEGIEELRARAHDLGLVMSDDAVAAGVTLGDTIDDVKQSFSAIVTHIGVEVMPIIQGLADWILAAMPTIQAVLGKVFDFFATVVNTCVDFITMLKDAATDWLASHQDTVEQAKTFLSGLWEFIQTVFAALMAAVQVLGDWLGAFWNEHLSGLVSSAMSYISAVLEAVRNFGQFCYNFWQQYGSTIMSILGPIFSAIQTAFGAMFDIISGLLSIFANAFRGNWSGVWEGVKSIASTIADAIKNIVGNMLQALVNTVAAIGSALFNAGRSAFNSLFDGIKSVWDGICSWVTDKVNWIADKLSFWNSSRSQMSANGSHATGLEYVPFDGYRAILHKGERVLTADEAKALDKNTGGATVVKVEIGQFVNNDSDRDIDELVEIIDQKLEEKRERDDDV